MPDREVEALQAVTDALSDLDRAACARVLKWAEDRYVTEHGSFSSLDPKWMSSFTEGMVSAARDLGGLTPREVMQAASAIYAQAQDSSARTTDTTD